MKELGDYLSEIRKNNGVSIEEASDDLNIPLNSLKNIENGNVRAFKDMLELRETVKVYSKYLGLNPDDVVDEFNDFLFEHTSKIKLQDILDAEKDTKKKKQENISSPYTNIKIRDFNTKYIKIIGIAVLFVLVFIVAFLIIRSILTIKTHVNTELLCSYNKEEVI